MPTRINPLDGRAAHRRWLVAVLMALALLAAACATAVADDAAGGDPPVAAGDPAPPPATEPEPVDDGTTPPPPASGEEDPGTVPDEEPPVDPVTPVDPAPVDPGPVDETPVPAPPPATDPLPTTDGGAVVAPPPSGPDKPPARTEREAEVPVAAVAATAHTEEATTPAAPVLTPVPTAPAVTVTAPRVTTRRAVAKHEVADAAEAAPLPVVVDPPPSELLLTPARGRVTVDDLAPAPAAPAPRVVTRKPVAPPAAPRRHREEVATPTGLAAFITASPSDDSASPSLLDTLASRFVPGIDGGATLPTSLLIILELVLVGLLALPRAPRRVGHVVETAWHPLEGVHSRPARPG